MEPLAFFHTETARQILEQASHAAAMSVSVHYVDHEEEGPPVAGFGHCAACRHVAGMTQGVGSCRDSRIPASLAALRRHKSTPFICHMGFACVAAPALSERGTGFVMTLGPYCPAEAPLSLEEDARRGLAKLGLESERDQPLPFPLSDIRIVPSDAPPILVEWTRQRLVAAWDACRPSVAGGPEPKSAEAEPPQRRRGKHVRGADPYQATAIVLALGAGNQAQARALLKGALSETESAKQVRLAVRRARTVALAGAALEAGERAGLTMGRCWGQFPSFLEQVRQTRTDADLSAAALRLLGLVKPRARRKLEDSSALTKLNAIVTARLVEGVTLNEVAKELKETPTAITHRLQRKFGMSFSQYLGRLRTDKAKELLRRTGLDVREVARRVGINDASNLGKLFRKFEGLSPTAYRAKFRSQQ